MANGNRSVLVVGLGRFGSAVATTLDHMGQDVLAVDRNAELVSRWSSILPTVQADLTDVMAVEQIGITDFTTAVVAIGDSGGGLGPGDGQPAGRRHQRHLGQIRFPPACAHSRTHRRHAHHQCRDRCRQRVGHLVSGNYLDYIEIDGPHTVVKIHTPNHLIGYSIAEAQVHERYGVTVVAVKSPNRDLEYGSKDLVMHRNDELILMGTQDQIERLIRG